MSFQNPARVNSVPRNGGNSGFSLIELLVVVGTIGVLTALLFPAIQYARAGAQRTACLNNIRQLGLGLHSYESSHGAFPPGITGGSRSPFFQPWTQRVLPHIGLQQIYDRAMQDYQAEPNPERHYAGLAAIVGVFQCPSEPDTGVVHNVAGRLVATTSYLGVNGTNWEHKDGMFFEDSLIRTADVADGLSNTLLVGERAQRSDHFFGWWYTGAGQNGTGSVGTNLGVREMRAAVPPKTTNGLESCPVGPYFFQSGRPESPCDALHFWSHHWGGAVFAFADGSVRLIGYDANDLMPPLATRAGNEVVQVPE